MRGVSSHGPPHSPRTGLSLDGVDLASLGPNALPDLLRTQKLGWQITRSILMAATTTCNRLSMANCQWMRGVFRWKKTTTCR